MLVSPKPKNKTETNYRSSSWGGAGREAATIPRIQGRGVSKEWNYENDILLMLWLDVSSYCKATNTSCMFLMGTCLRGACKWMLSNSRKRWSPTVVLKPCTPYLSLSFLSGQFLLAHYWAAACNLQNISRFSRTWVLKPGRGQVWQWSNCENY